MANAAKKLAPTRGVPITDPAFVPEYDEDGIIINDPDALPLTEEQLARMKPRNPSKVRGLPLAMLRKGAGLSQGDVSAKSGMLQPQISKVEGAGDEIQVSTLRRYIEALGGKLELRMVSPHGSWKIKL